MAAGTLSASVVLSTEIKTKDTWCAVLADYPSRGDPRYDSTPRAIEGRWRGWHGARFRNANGNHDTLMEMFESYISDKKILMLLKEVVDSFSSIAPGVGLPLGNLTSQLFVNVYMNEFDQFVKHVLKAKHYMRYADDFVILASNREWLEIILPEICNFLANRLKLTLHPNKVSIKTLASGVDILGWIHFPDHRVLRTRTKRRAVSRVAAEPEEQRIASYIGMLKHGNGIKITRTITKIANEREL